MPSLHQQRSDSTEPPEDPPHHHHHPSTLDSSTTSALQDAFLGKKRPRDEPQQLSNIHKTIRSKEQSSSISADMSSTTPTAAETFLTPEQIQGLRLEAIFHPKFDNEKRDQQSSRGRPDDGFSSGTSSRVRTAMLQKLSQDEGYLEVSLKHSGSLILWSGQQRYYSKNSCRNQFTQVAEILLRQHFVRAWWNDHADQAEHCMETKYHQCSRYIEERRLTLAFEVVTAVLGDHGDIPTKDFLILTAVADRKHERFFATPQVLEFCQRFRLPHNDVWTYTSPESARRLFQMYDSCRETGLAEDTVQALSDTADAYVPSMCPHVEFQGNILEGFIIRYVAHDDQAVDRTSASRMQQLAKGAQDILQQAPPNRPPSFELISSRREDVPPALFTDLRALYQSIPFDYELASLRSPGTAANEQGQQFQQKLSEILGQAPAHGEGIGENDRLDLTRATGGKVHLPSLVKHLLDDSSTDVETKRIAQLLQSLDGIKGVVNYSLFTMPCDRGRNGTERRRLFCMVHVVQDATFFKFQRQQSEDGMSLFRGFCIELLRERLPESGASAGDKGFASMTKFSDSSPPTSVESVEEDKFLMLKMKLLPYMVRTFICRNLLRILEKEGPQQFSATAVSLLERWGISEESIQKWMPFFSGWSQYVAENKNLDGPKLVKDATGRHVDLGPLTNFAYLHHLEHFTKLYDSGKIKVDRSAGQVRASSFQGVVCVVSESTDISKAIAMFFAKELATNNGATQVDVASLQDAVKMKTMRSCVLYTALGEKIKGVKAFLSNPKVAKQLFLVFVGSDQESLLDRFGGNGGSGASLWFPVLSQSELKRLESVWENVWKKQSCQKVFLMPCSAVTFESNDGNIEVTSTSELTHFANIIQTEATNINFAGEAKVSDPTQRGVLVFFPGIPGSGKSSVVASMESKLQQEISAHPDDIGGDRKVYVKEGDKVGKAFWNLAGNLLLDGDDPRPSLFIADKNVPPLSWPKVGQICGDAKALPVIVLPDEHTLETTTVEGAITPEGIFQPFHSHFYPFSLKYLAVCLERVMSRPAGEHCGKLDSGMPTACMLVVQFFSFYRSNSADTLNDNIITKLDDSGASSADLLQPITLPFLSSDGRAQTLPDDLEKLLLESLQIRYGHDMSKKTKLSKSDEQLLELETRLRACLEKHKSFLRSWSMSLEESQAAFTRQLFDRLAFLKKCGSLKRDVSPEQRELSESSKKLKLVSIDVDRSEIHGVLEKLEQSGEISEFLKVARSQSSNALDAYDANNQEASLTEQIDAYPPPRFIEETHVTMAFAGRKSSAKTLIQKFRGLQGNEVGLHVNGFLWSSAHAAFSVEIANRAFSGNGASDEVEVPECENAFPHITVWCAAGAKAFHSNNLPRLVDAGEASKVQIIPEIELHGKLMFWDHGNKPFKT